MPPAPTTGNDPQPAVPPTGTAEAAGQGGAQWKPIAAEGSGAYMPSQTEAHAPASQADPISQPERDDDDIFNGVVGSRPARGSSSQVTDIFAATDGDGSLDDDDVAAGLAEIDPLTVRPRISSLVLAVVLGLLCLAGAAGIYFFGVHTLHGQNYDEISFNGLKGAVPGWFAAVAQVLKMNGVVVVISLVVAVAALAVAAVRKRWWLLGQIVVFGVVCYALAWLKRLLPRPFIINTISDHANSAPSGHTLLAAGASLALLLAVPRVWRALVGVLGAAYTVLVAVSLVDAQWHRPSDVLMSMLIAAGMALLTMALTRKSGMDDLGSCAPSASIQIVASVMITFGICSCCYAGYLFWQLYPGLDIGAQWTYGAAYASFAAATIGLACLLFGLALAVRQLTASPLTRLGLIGAPPAPPRR